MLIFMEGTHGKPLGIRTRTNKLNPHDVNVGFNPGPQRWKGGCSMDSTNPGLLARPVWYLIENFILVLHTCHGRHIDNNSSFSTMRVAHVEDAKKLTKNHTFL